MDKLKPQLLKNTLILGGARSGKSRYAESLIETFGQGLYLATAVDTGADLEMSARITKHRERRGKIWETIEEPLNIVEIIKSEARSDRPILVDCLTLWLSNLMLEELNLTDEVEKLTQSLENISGSVIFVSNEVGLGIIPEKALARDFRDWTGNLNEAVAKVCGRVEFVVAGLTMIMKDQ